VFVFGLQVCSFSATVVTYDSEMLLCTGVRLSAGWLSVRLSVLLGLRLEIGLGIGLGIGRVWLGLGIGLVLGIGIADLKLSVLAPFRSPI